MDDFPPISRDNERKAWSQIKMLCAAALAEYPHSIDDDREILATADDLNDNERTAVNFTLGEKTVLSFLITFGNLCT